MSLPLSLLCVCVAVYSSAEVLKTQLGGMVADSLAVRGGGASSSRSSIGAGGESRSSGAGAGAGAGSAAKPVMEFNASAEF